MKKYYLDLQYQDPVYKDTYYSYEQGAFDDMCFSSREEAKKYASYRSSDLDDDERLVVREAY